MGSGHCALKGKFPQFSCGLGYLQASSLVVTGSHEPSIPYESGMGPCGRRELHAPLINTQTSTQLNSHTAKSSERK